MIKMCYTTTTITIRPAEHDYRTGMGKKEERVIRRTMTIVMVTVITYFFTYPGKVHRCTLGSAVNCAANKHDTTNYYHLK